MRNQLDLFKAEVLVFPVSAWRRDVDQMATFLRTVHGKHAKRGWRRHCLSIAGALRAAGVAEDEIRRQMLAFQAAVQQALWETHETRRRPEGGAA